MTKKKRANVENDRSGADNKSGSKIVIGKITSDQLLKLKKAAERKIRLESGFDAASMGTGVHGGTKKQVRRRTRRRADDDVQKELEEAN